MAAPPPKRLKTDTPSLTQRFLPRYTTKWDFIVRSSQGEHYAFCKYCKKDFQIGRSGEYDIKRHNEGVKHKQAAASTVKMPSVAAMFSNSVESKEKKIKEQAREAELTLVSLIADLNLPIASADKFSKAFKTLFPDSEVAKEFSCCRTKATALAMDLAKIHEDKLFKRMRDGPFTLSTDGSNDEKDKLFPLVVRTINDNLSVESELLSLAVCHDSVTGENIFNLLDTMFSINNIPWTNCIAFGSDNASVMTGVHKGVFSFIKKKHPSCFLAGCTLHLVHIGAEKASNCLPFSPADLLTDLYYFFKKSSLRLQGLSSFQSLYGQDQKKMLKHVSTRWLSISRCLDRLIENWEPLRSYFQSEKDEKKKSSAYAQSKVKLIWDKLNSRSARLYTFFLRYASSIFAPFLLEYQCSAPRISKLRNSMLSLLKDILKQFVKPSAFAGNKLATDVDFTSAYNIKAHCDIFIGKEAKDYLILKKEHFNEEKMKEFYGHVVTYFQTVATYLKNNLPFHYNLLLDLSITDPQNIAADDMNRKVEVFLKKFPILLQGYSYDEVMNSFADLQICSIDESEGRDDHSWIKIMECNPSVKPACLVLLGLLTIPHGSAHCERVFSCVRKNRTVFRPNLGTDTLESLMILKHMSGGPLSQTFTAKELAFLRSSTVRAVQC